MSGVILGLLLLALTCASTMVRCWLPVPLPLLQILLGIVAALFGLHVRFEPHTFLLLFIPPLLFADGWRLPRQSLHALRWKLLANAVGLVFVNMLVAGAALHWLIPDMPLAVAFAIGAVVSPTDAVAVSAIIGHGAMPRRLMHLLESEALLNDASGLVAFRFAVAAALSGTFSLPRATLSFLAIGAGGLAIGVALSFGLAWLLRRLPHRPGDPPVQAVLTVLLPFAAYLAAEHLGVSGILAAVGAGMAANRAGLLEQSHYAARLQSGSMWRLIEFCFNGVIFVLLGTQLPGIVGPQPGGLDLTSGTPLSVLGQIVGLTLLLITIRFVWAAVSLAIERLAGIRDELPDRRVLLAASFAGVRGAITLAGVLTLPLQDGHGNPFPSRDHAITLATGVILLSMLVASIALPMLLRHLDQDHDPRADALDHARIGATEAAIAAIEAHPDVAPGRRRAVLEAYRHRLQTIRHQDRQALGDKEDAWRELHTVAMSAEREAVQKMRDDDEIDDESAREVIAELDLIEAASMRRPLRMRPVDTDMQAGTNEA